MVKVNPKDFRIGNLVKTNQGIFKVFAICPTSFVLQPFLSEDTHYRLIKDIQPVLINQETLSLFGIKTIIFGQRTETGILGNKKVICKLNIDSEYFEYEGLFFMRLKYIHDLQNLYLLLKGEELKIR